MADSIPSNTSSTKVLEINTSDISEIDFNGDKDWWKVNLVQGFRYQVWIEGSLQNKGTLVDPYLSVYSGAGVFSFANDDASFLSYYSYAYITPQTTGFLFLSAEESGNNAKGTYTITIWQDELASTSSAAILDVNKISAIGRVGWQGDSSDWYKVTLTAGIQYQFDMIGAGGDGSTNELTLVDPYLVLRDSNGLSLIVNDDSGLDHNARIYYTPQTTDSYFLDAQEFGSNAYGSYRLIVNSAPISGAITLGVLKEGTIGFAGDADLFSISLEAGKTYGFSLEGKTLEDPFIEILDSTGKTIKSDDDTGDGLNSFTIFTPTTSGTYYLSSRSSGNNKSGSYSALAWEFPSVSISNGAVVEGDSGTQNISFDITLSKPSPIDVSITVNTSGTATATYSVDYEPKSSIIKIAAGETNVVFSVAIKGDDLFEPTESFHVLLSSPVNAILGESDAYGIITDDDSPYTLPSDTLFGFQWYLYPQVGINVLKVWDGYTGAGVRVAVFDQGIDPNHPDLKNKLLKILGRNSADLTLGGSPILSTDNHGTMVAGVISAELNSTGLLGVAYGSDLVSIYSPLSLDHIGTQIANAYVYAKNFDIINDSWGFANGFQSGATWAFYDNFEETAFSAAGAALADLAKTGRNGLGTIVVQSAGNSMGVGDDTNLHNFQNSQYIITVAATDYSGNITSYSSPGASVLIAAPGGGGTDFLSNIITTDRVGASGSDSSDFASTTGTSFSAPIVSGVIALMLEANPNLGYRDVQEILAYSALKISSNKNNWRYNGAENWNGGGLHYDALEHNLGFGLVDALAAVRLAETWSTRPHTSENKEQISTTHSVAKIIPDGGGINATASAFDSILIDKVIDIERVEVTLNVTHPFIGDLSILVTSPNGTSSFLLWRPQQNPLSAYGTNKDNIHFTFDTVLNWGENSQGLWSLSIYDNAYGDVGTFDSWALNLIGKPNSDNDIYIYTDEFLSASEAEVSRKRLNDTSGIDTINASAVTNDLILNLRSGSVSSISGASLTMEEATVIENAYGGDGNDNISGNDTENILFGMRGDDSLYGREGSDNLVGGAGNDLINGGDGEDNAVFRGAYSEYVLTGTVEGWVISGLDGADTLISIENATFQDQVISLGNFTPNGTVTITGELVQDKVLTANNNLSDKDGLGIISYQWQADGINISTANDSTFILTQDQVGKRISVNANYTDLHANIEVVTSDLTLTISPRDTDGDNWANVYEARDGNFDGISDQYQSNVTSSDQVALVVDSVLGIPPLIAVNKITAFRNSAHSDSSLLPTGMTVPGGLVTFSSTVETGQQINLSLFLAASSDVNGYWQQKNDGTWVNLATSINDGGIAHVGDMTRLDFVVTDGGDFDSDHTPDGVINNSGMVGHLNLSLVGLTPAMPDDGFWL